MDWNAWLQILASSQTRPTLVNSLDLRVLDFAWEDSNTDLTELCKDLVGCHFAWHMMNRAERMICHSVHSHLPLGSIDAAVSGGRSSNIASRAALGLGAWAHGLWSSTAWASVPDPPFLTSITLKIDLTSLCLVILPMS